MMKKLGSTDIVVSSIGLGTVKFGRNQGVKYPVHFELPTDAEILDLLAVAKNLGINFLDTAPAYGTSEERLGKLLKGQRQQWIISSKFGEEFSNGESCYDFRKESARKSVERSLRRLNTDYLDMVLVHSDGEDRKIIEEYDVFGTLQEMKQAGLIRAFGMSTKTIAGGIMAVDHSDVVMVTYNPLQTEELPVIRHAQEKNKGVLIKKALASGHVDKIAAENPVRYAMEFIFREPGVSSVILGTVNKKHLAEVVESI